MAEPAAADAEAASSPGRRQLIRDTLVFQVKLFADGLRDLIFSPISIFLALIDLITGSKRFYQLLSLGHRTDRWINLFGSHDEPGLDEAVDRIEALVTEQYQKGGMSESAKRVVERSLEKLLQSRGGPHT